MLGACAHVALRTAGCIGGTEEAHSKVFEVMAFCLYTALLATS